MRLGGFADGIFVALGAGTWLWPERVALGMHANGVVNLEADSRPELQATKQYLYLQATCS